jgi:hypothetical protein
MPTSPARIGTGFDAYTMAANMSKIVLDGMPIDAQEMMLAEMMRVFNLGLGLTPRKNKNSRLVM